MTINTTNLKKIKNDLVAEIDKRIADKIIEKTNADLIKKLIEQAETVNEAIMIAELGTTYKRTGFHFDKRLEKMTDTIKYFKKNETLSFAQDKNALTHKLIIGDNYDALLNLLIEYRGMIDVIYIDPPYGKDSMGEFAQTNYENAITRDNLLSMLYPRLVLARQLLSDSGVIFCSIDDKNQAYVKGLFDEVFGESNFVANFIWQTTDGAQGIPKRTLVSDNHEYILSYSKDVTQGFRFFGLSREDDKGFQNKDNDSRGLWKRQYLQRFNQGFSKKTITDPKTGNVFTFETPYAQEKLEDWIKDNRIMFPETTDKYPAFKEFLSEYENNKQLTTTLGLYATKATTEKLDAIFSGKRLFDNPKPDTLMNFILRQATNEYSIVLDFFAGSGTTGQAVLELNKEDKQKGVDAKRKYILVQLDEDLDKAMKDNPKSKTIQNQIMLCDDLKRPHKLSEVTVERLKRVMVEEKYKLGDNLDVYDIATVANFESTEGGTPFEVIDETLYGQKKLGVKEKIKWVCENFEGTQKTLEDK